MELHASKVEKVRLRVGKTISQENKSFFGQFMTPAKIANFMASIFSTDSMKMARLLDPGAGIGSLSAAFLDRWVSRKFNFMQVETTAYEIDNVLRSHLSKTIRNYACQKKFSSQILSTDFIEDAVAQIKRGVNPCYTHAILNPPYKKILSSSRHRLLLRQVGIETVNLYSAFVALTILLMKPGGQIVAIIPRSFCNGPYYKPFRELLLTNTAIRQIHLFATRNKAFKDDEVLQENIIIMLEKDGRQNDVMISTSTDGSLVDYNCRMIPFERVVSHIDTEKFIHIPISKERSTIELSETFCNSLEDINVKVSTGPVVDFRVRDYLCDMPKLGSVPLLYPCHFVGQSIEWPKIGTKKPNALMNHHETNKLLYPNGFYVVVRRFSSKEEKRRIIASVVYPKAFNTSMLGFENHLNVFHDNKKGLSEKLAYGLSIFLNSTMIDDYFRLFNGHTQVNATDLRLMKYPSREILIKLGQWAKAQRNVTQMLIDQQLELIV